MPSSRRNAHSLSLFSLLFASCAAAQEECLITHQGNKYDLTSIAGDHFVTRTRETPPSFMVDDVHFNLCGDLRPLDGVEPSDQCPSGTSACMTTTNRKGGQPDRVVAVIPLAQFSEPEYETLSSPKGLAITRQGASYPASPDPVAQSFRISLQCATETSPPSFKSYDGARVEVEWSTTAGCPFQGEPGDDNGGEDKGDKGGSDGSVGSGIGWFFLVLLLAFAAYFILGAYYNYATYGATGFDLVPHRDFWREVPYMLQDVVSHLCSSFRPRSSRGGYIAV